MNWLPFQVGCSKSMKIKVGKEAPAPLKGAHISNLTAGQAPILEYEPLSGAAPWPPVKKLRIILPCYLLKTAQRFFWILNTLILGNNVASSTSVSRMARIFFSFGKLGLLSGLFVHRDVAGIKSFTLRKWGVSRRGMKMRPASWFALKKQISIMGKKQKTFNTA